MEKTYKILTRFIALTLVFVLLACLFTACGNEAEEETTTLPETTSQVTTTLPETQTQTTTAVTTTAAPTTAAATRAATTRPATTQPATAAPPTTAAAPATQAPTAPPTTAPQNTYGLPAAIVNANTGISLAEKKAMWDEDVRNATGIYGYCERCGKPVGNGTHGTCTSSVMRDRTCQLCGKTVKVNTCHSCVY